MNDSDSIENAKVLAKNLAIENVQKKIADYIHSLLKDRPLILSDDETLAIAEEISIITDVKYKIGITVTAKFEDKDIMNYLIKFFEERTDLIAKNVSIHNEISEITQQIIIRDKIELAKKKFDEADRLYYTDAEGAIKLYDEAIELNPNYAEAYNSRGECYRGLKQYEQAIQDYSKAIELNPNDAWLYILRGECYTELGYYSKSISDLNKASQLGRKE